MNLGDMKSDSESSHPTAGAWDRVFLQSRRELIGILIIWFLLAVWVVGGAWYSAYTTPSDELSLVWGIPSWVFWSVGVPWMVANLLIIWFCTRFMKDQSLEAEEDSGGENAVSGTEKHE